MGDWSKLVFGNEHFLAVALMVFTAEPQELYAGSIADQLEVDWTEVDERFDDLRLAKLLKRDRTVERPPGKRGRPPAYHSRIDDGFWQCLWELGERFRR